MSGILRLGQLPLVQFLKSKTQVLFSRKYLLLTNTSITMCLSTTGDLMQQRYEIYSKRQNKWDPLRSKHICVSGMFVGPANHFWYIFLDWLLPGRTFRIVAKKLVLDQMIFSPVNISLFLAVVGRQEGMSWHAIWNDMRDKGLQLFIAESIIWPPAQIVNFYFLPTRFRVLYDNTISLGFDYYYSYVKFRKDTSSLSVASTDIENEAPDEPKAGKTESCATDEQVLNNGSGSDILDGQDHENGQGLMNLSRTCRSLQQSLHVYERASRHVHIFDFEDIERRRGSNI